MAGYNWNAGKSNNAVAAENIGLMVASKAATALRKAGVKRCTAKAVAAALPVAEWHHSSKFFNRVNYYDIRAILTVLAGNPYGVGPAEGEDDQPVVFVDGLLRPSTALEADLTLDQYDLEIAADELAKLRRVIG